MVDIESVDRLFTFRERSDFLLLPMSDDVLILNVGGQFECV